MIAAQMKVYTKTFLGELVYRSSCLLNYQPPETVVSHQHEQLDLRHTEEFPHGAELKFRCEQLGAEFLDGNSTLTCVDGEWDSVIPFCLPTSTRRRFSGNKNSTK